MGQSDQDNARPLTHYEQSHSEPLTFQLGHRVVGAQLPSGRNTTAHTHTSYKGEMGHGRLEALYRDFLLFLLRQSHRIRYATPPLGASISTQNVYVCVCECVGGAGGLVYMCVSICISGQ